MHSRVVQNDHTLILGWCSRTVFLLDKLLTDDNPPQCIVILDTATRDEVHSAMNVLPKHLLLNTQIIVWQGDPADTKDLDRVSVSSAFQIFILGNAYPV